MRELSEDEFRELQRRTGHRCPPWCHRCPLMQDRDVMPFCWGSVNNPNPRSLDRCCCTKPKKGSPLEIRVEQLERQVAELLQLLKGKS